MGAHCRDASTDGSTVIGIHIKWALAHVLATVKINLGCRISEAEAVYAAPDTALTPDEQTRIFLLDHGLINANELEALLMRCNLSQRTAKFLSNRCVCNAISEERLAGSAATLPAGEAAPALGSSQAEPSADFARRSRRSGGRSKSCTPSWREASPAAQGRHARPAETIRLGGRGGTGHQQSWTLKRVSGSPGCAQRAAL